MEKKSICKSITAGKEYDNKFSPGEKIHPWNIVWENGDEGQRGTKTNEPPYVVGKEYSYECVEGVWPDGKKKLSFKAVDTKGFKKQDPKLKLRPYALKYATRMVTGGVIERPTDVENESAEDFNKFTERVQKSAKLYYKLMMDDSFKYGDDNVDAIGTAMSQAIDLVVEKKIDKNKMLIFYTRLIESILVVKQPQVEQK
jgi:hypothetical protein